MKATLSQKLNILKSKKTFINYTVDNNNNLVNNSCVNVVKKLL